MMNHEVAINGILEDQSHYRELKDQLEEVISNRINEYLMPEVLAGILTDDKMAFLLVEEDLKHVAKMTLEKMLGNSEEQ
jgi:hypothetical protein